MCTGNTYSVDSTYVLTVALWVVMMMQNSNNLPQHKDVIAVGWPEMHSFDMNPEQCCQRLVAAATLLPAFVQLNGVVATKSINLNCLELEIGNLPFRGTYGCFSCGRMLIVGVPLQCVDKL